MQPRDKFFNALMNIRARGAGALTTSDSIAQPALIDTGDALNAAAMERVRAALTLSAQQGRWSYVLDLSRVSSVDSCGLAMLVSSLRSLRDVGGSVGLVTNRADIQRILELCARNRSCRIFAQTADALSALSYSTQPKTAA